MTGQPSAEHTQPPLCGLRVVELGGIGPVPHIGLLLSGLGADVVRIDGAPPVMHRGRPSPMLRGRRNTVANLKDPATRGKLLDLIELADVLVEGYRPGVAERLGVGPAECMERNPRLVYGRMTGWGQTGPLASRAGHDINYISLTGVLDAIGHASSRPVPPLNLLGDFGGGSMYMMVGLLAALLERERSGRGQVVDAAIVDGTASLAQYIWAMRGEGRWHDERGTNILDSGAPFYDTYECADGRYVAVGAVEPKFYDALLRGLGLDAADLPPRDDRSQWAALRQRLAAVFLQHSRDEWAHLFADTDACVTPVLTFGEAAGHPQLADRQSLVCVGDVVQAAPGPKYSRSRLKRPAPARDPDILDDLYDRWRHRV